MATIDEQQRKAALNSLAERRAHKPKRIDNGALPAGSPMYFYCKSCGWLADTLPEDYFLTRARQLCSECQAMKDHGWLEAAP